MSEVVNMDGFSVEHELKCDTKYFVRVQTGQKTFEIRKNDRNFQVGDYLILREYDRSKGCYFDCSPVLRARITYITDFVQRDGYVVLGIKLEGAIE